MKPFIVENGQRGFEVHNYEYDKDGRRWEKTIAGPYCNREAAKIYLAGGIPSPDIMNMDEDGDYYDP